MKLEGIIILAGVIVCISGTIFHLQGHSIVGPESSFMYSNPEWITYGIQIIIIGVVVLVSGFLLRIIRKG